MERAFVKNEQLAFPDHGPRKSDNLALTDGQITPTTSHGAI